jgi:hypothetical protein
MTRVIIKWLKLVLIEKCKFTLSESITDAVRYQGLAGMPGN